MNLAQCLVQVDRGKEEGGEGRKGGKKEWVREKRREEGERRRG